MRTGKPWRGKLGTIGLLLSLYLGGLHLGADPKAPNLDPGICFISGTVLDKNGQPVPHAEVRVIHVDLRKGVPISKAAPNFSLDSDFNEIGTCDEAGIFVITDVPRNYIYTCVAAAPGYGPEFVKEIDPKVGFVKFVLPKLDPSQQGGMARGHVVDAQGKSIANAQVRPDEFHKWDLRTNYPGRQVPRTVTDKDGNFSIEPAPPYQAVDVLIIAPGVARKYFTFVPYNNETQELVMEKGVTVTGRLVKDGRPLPNISVGIAQKENAILDEINATTDWTGQFELKDVAPGDEYEVYAKRDSLGMIGVPVRKLVTINKSKATLPIGDVSVVSGHKITGQITFSEGKPALNRPVQLHVYRPETADYQYMDLSHDLKFELMVRDGEEITLSAWIEGYHLEAPKEQLDLKVTPDLDSVELRFVPE